MYIFTFSCNSGGKQQPCSIMLKYISVTICQNTFWSWQNGILQCLQFICFTQRVLITVVHDMNYYIVTQVFTFCNYKLENNVFTMNGISFSRIIKRLLSLEKNEMMQQSQHHYHLLSWGKITVLLFFLSFHCKPNLASYEKLEHLKNWSVLILPRDRSLISFWLGPTWFKC